MSLEKAITECRFAYGLGAASRQMQPPPRTLALEAVSLPVAQLFDKAFLQTFVQHNLRPTAKEWIAALDGLYPQIQTCAIHPGHHYFKGLMACPWCTLDASGHHPIFNIAFRNVVRSQSNFNLTTIWAQIEAVQSPGAMSLPSPHSIATLSPSTEALKLRASRLKCFLIAAFALLGAGGIVCASMPNYFALWIAVGGIGMLFACSLAETYGSPKRIQMKETLNTAQTAVRTLETRWQQETQEERFFQKRRELWALKVEYEKLPTLHQQRLQELTAQSRERQLRRFLDQYEIENANLNGLGPSRIATLQSYGIETAADIEESAILAVPGFGPVYATKLLVWRRMIEHRFVFDPLRGIDPADTAALNKEMEAKRGKLEQQLQSGASQLNYVAQQINAHRQNLAPALQQAYRMVAQIALDCRRVNNPFSR